MSVSNCLFREATAQIWSHGSVLTWFADLNSPGRSNIGVFMGGPGGFSEYSQVPKDFIYSWEWIALFGKAKDRQVQGDARLFKRFKSD